MLHKKIALFIFDMIIVVISVTGLLVALGAMDDYDRDQEAKHIARVEANKSNDAALLRAEWVLLMDKGDMMTTFKAAMK
jgi:hypothetical protein